LRPQHFIVLLLIISGYFVYLVYKPFLQAIAIAVLLMFATLGISRKIEKRFSHRWQISAIMTMLLGLMFFAPLVYLINAAAILVANIDTYAITEHLHKIAVFLQSVSLPGEWLEKLQLDPQAIHSAIVDIFSEEHINGYLKEAGALLGTLAAHSAAFFKDMVLILIFYFFAYLYGESIGHFIKRILPLDTAQTQLLFGAVVMFFGLDAVLLGILYGFASLVPVIGGALMWVPVSLYLWSTQGATAAIVVAVYSIVVISIIADTFIKPMIIKEIDYKLLKETNALNEILVFFSIIAGLATFGFWGMIIGPAITTLFIAILKLYDQLQTTLKEKA